MDAGKRGTVLGPEVTANGIVWMPLLWDGDEDPDWHKSAGLEEIPIIQWWYKNVPPRE
jgi:hypothetical protein